MDKKMTALPDGTLSKSTANRVAALADDEALALVESVEADLHPLGGLSALDHLHPDISVGIKLGNIRAIVKALAQSAGGAK